MSERHEFLLDYEALVYLVRELTEENDRLRAQIAELRRRDQVRAIHPAYEHEWQRMRELYMREDVGEPEEARYGRQSE